MSKTSHLVELLLAAFRECRRLISPTWRPTRGSRSRSNSSRRCWSSTRWTKESRKLKDSMTSKELRRLQSGTKRSRILSKESSKMKCWLSRNHKWSREMPNKYGYARRFISWPPISKRTSYLRKRSNTKNRRLRSSSRKKPWFRLSKITTKIKSWCSKTE